MSTGLLLPGGRSPSQYCKVNRMLLLVVITCNHWSGIICGVVKFSFLKALGMRRSGRILSSSMNCWGAFLRTWAITIKMSQNENT